MLYFTLLTQLVYCLHSPALEGSFESGTKYYAKGEAYSGTVQRELTEIAWRGERISAQIVIWSNGGKVDNVQYVISDFTEGQQVIPAENASVRFIEYARTDRKSRACGEYSSRNPEAFDELGDVLSSKQVSTVEPGMPLRLWLTMNIPASTDPGLYKGTFSVQVDESSVLDFQINIQVVEYQLPEVSDWEFHLDLWQFPTAVIDRYNEQSPLTRLEYWSREHFMLLEPKYRMLADMGQKVITAHIKDGALGAASMIKWIKRIDGTWDYDFTAFDRYVDSMMSWGIDKQISCQSPVGWNKDEIPYWDETQQDVNILPASPGSDVYNLRWDHFLTCFKIHLDSAGWFKRTVLYFDEVAFSEMTAVVQMIKNNHPDWKMGLAGFHSPTDFINSKIFDLSMMVGIPANKARPDRLRTFYFSCNPPHPNNFIVTDARPADNIWIAWHALHKGYHGFLRWAYDYWLEADPYEMRTGGHASGDFSFCYRTSNTMDMQVNSSVRLELIRVGIQDFEKVKILRIALENSSSKEDQLALALLDKKIEEFKATSGGSATVTDLVRSAQKLLRDMVTRNYDADISSDSF